MQPQPPASLSRTASPITPAPAVHPHATRDDSGNSPPKQRTSTENPPIALRELRWLLQESRVGCGRRGDRWRCRRRRDTSAPPPRPSPASPRRRSRVSHRRLKRDRRARDDSGNSAPLGARGGAGVVGSRGGSGFQFQRGRRAVSPVGSACGARNSRDAWSFGWMRRGMTSGTHHHSRISLFFPFFLLFLTFRWLTHDHTIGGQPMDVWFVGWNFPAYYLSENKFPTYPTK
jgi:hypothetical protein